MIQRLASPDDVGPGNTMSVVDAEWTANIIENASSDISFSPPQSEASPPSPPELEATIASSPKKLSRTSLDSTPTGGIFPRAPPPPISSAAISVPPASPPDCYFTPTNSAIPTPHPSKTGSDPDLLNFSGFLASNGCTSIQALQSESHPLLPPQSQLPPPNDSQSLFSLCDAFSVSPVPPPPPIATAPLLVTDPVRHTTTTSTSEFEALGGGESSSSAAFVDATEHMEAPPPQALETPKLEVPVEAEEQMTTGHYEETFEVEALTDVTPGERKTSQTSDSSGLSVFGAAFQTHVKTGLKDADDLAVDCPERRPVPTGVSAEHLEDAQKLSILVVSQNGSKTPVSWYADMEPRDVRAAILCACDSIMNSGFRLREATLVSTFSLADADSSTDTEETVHIDSGGTMHSFRLGNLHEFEQLHLVKPGTTYILESAPDRPDLKNITGDKWRRLTVAIEPLMHVESQKALQAMKRGTNLLKHSRSAWPHLRQFQLTSDGKRLVTYTTQRNSHSIVLIRSIQDIRLGQSSPNFLQYRLPMLEHLSFSVVIGWAKTLDLTCKDEFEFDCWVTGLKALMHATKGTKISKKELLSHSRRFRKALESQNSGVNLWDETSPHVADTIGLDQCVELPFHRKLDLEKKLDRLTLRLRVVSESLQKLERPQIQQRDNEELFENLSDDDMEYQRMLRLVDTVTLLLHRASRDLGTVDTEETPSSGTLSPTPSSHPSVSAGTQARLRTPPAFEPTSGGDGGATTASDETVLKKVNQLLWKAEVDLENIEDMYVRFMTSRSPGSTIARTVAELNGIMVEELQKFGRSVSHGLREMFHPLPPAQRLRPQPTATSP